MSCSFNQLAHLMCNVPDYSSVIEHLAVYFKSDSGEENIVARCSQLNDFECAVEDGFSCSLQDSRHAEITLPESFFQKSGTFRCQISGMAKSDIERCHWPPDASYGSENFMKLNTSFGFQEPQTHTELPGTEDFPSAAVIGAVIGAAISIILLALILFVLFKIKHKRGLVDKEKSCRGKSDSETSSTKILTTEPVDIEKSLKKDDPSRLFISLR